MQQWKPGVHINASCGGEGVCGKCRVIIEKGDVKDGISERLKPEDLKKDTALPANLLLIKMLSFGFLLNQVLISVS